MRGLEERVEIVAFGDVFEDKAKGAYNTFKKKYGKLVTANPDNVHGGLDNYQKVLGTPGLNYVILATPPGFRPLHIAAAVKAGKHIFTEKPVGVDGPGIARIDDNRLTVARQHPDIVVLERRDRADCDRAGGRGRIHRSCAVPCSTMRMTTCSLA